MSRKAFYVLRAFKGGEDGTMRRGYLEHAGGSHVCYWQALAKDVPPPGQYQMLLNEGHIALRDHPAEIHPAGAGKGIEIGRVLEADRVSLHGDWMLRYLADMHRTRDAQGVGTWLEVR